VIPGAATGDVALSRGSKLDSLRAMGLCLVGAALTLMIPFVENVYLYTLVTLLGACVVVPFAIDWHRHRLDIFAPIHVFGALYFVWFGLGALWTVQDPGKVAYDLNLVAFVPQATLYCLLGYLALLAGYYVPWSRRPLPPRDEEWPRGASFIFVVGGLGLAGYLAMAIWTRASWVEVTLPAILGSLGQLSPLFLVAWTIAWLLFFARADTASQRLVLFAVLIPGAAFVAYLTVSMKSLVMVLLGVPAICRWYARRKVPWLALTVLMLFLVFVVFPFYNTFRWSDAEMSQTERLGETVHTLGGWDSENFELFSLGGVKRRMAMINSVAIVVRDVGRWVPYARGETLFTPLLTYSIPRFLWPDKPVLEEGRTFGRLFRVTNYLTRKTHIAATIPGELYWNFDLPGIVVGMALLGVAMGWMYRRYGASSDLDPVRRSIYVVLLVQLVHVEGSLAPAIVGAVRPLLLIEFLRWIARRQGSLVTRSRG
jgi:hypothetical protein